MQIKISKFLIGGKPNPVIELHPNEVWLLGKMRNELRFAEFKVKTQDGLPVGIEEGIIKLRPPAIKKV